MGLVSVQYILNREHVKLLILVLQWRCYWNTWGRVRKKALLLLQHLTADTKLLCTTPRCTHKPLQLPGQEGESRDCLSDAVFKHGKCLTAASTVTVGCSAYCKNVSAHKLSWLLEAWKSVCIHYGKTDYAQLTRINILEVRVLKVN